MERYKEYDLACAGRPVYCHSNVLLCLDVADVRDRN